MPLSTKGRAELSWALLCFLAQDWERWWLVFTSLVGGAGGGTAGDRSGQPLSPGLGLQWRTSGYRRYVPDPCVRALSTPQAVPGVQGLFERQQKGEPSVSAVV